jgi:SulP family sulfate permease
MLVAVLFGSSTRLSVGPSALTSLLVGASLIGLAEPGSAQWVQLAVWLALAGRRHPARVRRRRGQLGAEPGELAGAHRLQPGGSAADHCLAGAGAAGLKGALQTLWQAPQFDLTAMAYGVVPRWRCLWRGKRFAPRCRWCCW